MKKLSKQQVKNFKKGAVALTLAAAMGLAGLSAFFTDSKTKVNEFTVGNVKQELIEEKWDKAEEGAHDNITPNSTFEKDPKVKNTGTNSQYVFMTVTVPKADVVLADNPTSEAKSTELFTYTVNPGWTKLESKTTIGTDSNTYVYAYATDNTLTALANKDDTTPTLFDEITFANIVEKEEFAQNQLNVTVKSYGIQTTNLGETTPEKVWDIVSKEAK